MEQVKGQLELQSDAKTLAKAHGERFSGAGHGSTRIVMQMERSAISRKKSRAVYDQPKT